MINHSLKWEWSCKALDIPEIRQAELHIICKLAIEDRKFLSGLVH
jgi:hypothetical protein